MHQPDPEVFKIQFCNPHTELNKKNVLGREFGVTLDFLNLFPKIYFFKLCQKLYLNLLGEIL